MDDTTSFLLPLQMLMWITHSATHKTHHTSKFSSPLNTFTFPLPSSLTNFLPTPFSPHLLKIPFSLSPSSLPSILQQQWCSATNNKESIIYPTHKHHNVINKRWTKKCPKRMINAKIKPLMNYSCLSVCPLIGQEGIHNFLPVRHHL